MHVIIKYGNVVEIKNSFEFIVMGKNWKNSFQFELTFRLSMILYMIVYLETCY